MIMTAKTANVVARVGPFVPVIAPKAYDEMTKEEFDAAMATGLAQAKAGQSVPVDEVFDCLIGEIANG